MSKCGGAGGILTIDLGAIRANYRLLRARVGPAACGAVVKADAYGLGADAVAPVLAAEGCRDFFVALLAEAASLRPKLPANALLYVLNGLPRGAEADCAALGAIPVLNSAEQIDAWAASCRTAGRLPAALQVDTGMARLGLPAAELATYARAPERLDGIDICLVMSHLACAEQPGSALNAIQRDRFESARATLPKVPSSLANSSGIFLGAGYHFDLVRPGAALYGVAPVEGQSNPMRPVVRLQAPVVQVRDIAAGDTVGYGASWRAAAPARIATLAIGYADGLPRSLGGRGAAWLNGLRLPLVGRVSMDSATCDVTALPADAVRPGTLVDLIGPDSTLEAVAEAAGTIPYEVLTRLGHRYERRYIDTGMSG